MNTETIKIICKTILNGIFILTGGFIFVALFAIGLWPIALLLLFITILALMIYFAVFLAKMKGLKKTRQEIEDIKTRLKKIEKEICIDSLGSEKEKTE